MRYLSFSILSAVLLLSCDVLIDDIGHLGDPCSGNDSCYGELACINNTCSPRAQLGEVCDQSFPQGFFSDGSPRPEADCAEGLWCLRDICVEAGGENQPCRIGDWGHFCDEWYDYPKPPCDGDLMCYVEQHDEDLGVFATCRNVEDLASAGDPCLCQYGDSDEILCAEDTGGNCGSLNAMVCGEGLTCSSWNEGICE